MRRSITSTLFTYPFLATSRSVETASLGGGLPATGLAIVASYRSIPKLIFVETNILSRPVEQNLFDAFGANPSEPYQRFKPTRAFVSWVYYRIKYKSESENVKRLPCQRPTTYERA
jgi:hypothetical protein